MRGFVTARHGLIVCLLFAWSCAEEDSGAFAPSPDDGGNHGMGGDPHLFDLGPVPDADGIYDASPLPCHPDLVPYNCLETLSDVCAFRDTLVGCVDHDNDCFVTNCAELDEPYALRILDCDDRDPDVHPLAVEVCDDVDNDCDDLKEEGFSDKGDLCDACGMEGTVQCDIDDPTRTICAPASDIIAERLVETCNELDDDCDGVVDERCAVPGLPSSHRSSPVFCGDSLVYVQNNDVVALQRGRALEVVYADGDANTRPVHLVCKGDGLAWLEMRPDQSCTLDVLENRRCVASVWFARVARNQLGVFEAWELARVNSHGPPAVGDNAVYHAVHIDASPSQIRHVEITADGPINRPDVDEMTSALVDPVALPPTAEGTPQIALRRLEFEPPRARVITRTVDPMNLDGHQEGFVGDSGSSPGPPVASNEWVVWSTGAPTPSLWAVPMTNLENGFQPVNLPGPQLSPRIHGDTVIWLDAGTAPPTLRWMHLVTGLTRAVAQAQILPGDFDVTGDAIAWMEQTEEGPVLMVDGVLPGPEPEPPVVDGGVLDGGPSDANLPPVSPSDGSVDATPSDGGVGPVDGTLDVDAGPVDATDRGIPDAR